MKFDGLLKGLEDTAGRPSLSGGHTMTGFDPPGPVESLEERVKVLEEEMARLKAAKDRSTLVPP